MMLFLRIVIYAGISFIVGLVVLDFGSPLRIVISIGALLGVIIMVFGGETLYERYRRNA